MNRKMTLLLIAAVATILPAVAVADVMITGEISLEGNHHHTAFEFQPGPNYYAANMSNSIGWMPAQGDTMGTLDLQGSIFVYTYMINVIDLNTTVSNPAAPAQSKVLYLNVSSSTLPAGTIMTISTSEITFAQLWGTPVTTYTGTPIPVDTSSTSTVVAVDLSQNPPLAIPPIGPSDTFYLGFILPPGTYQGTGATLTGQFVALA